MLQSHGVCTASSISYWGGGVNCCGNWLIAQSSSGSLLIHVYVSSGVPPKLWWYIQSSPFLNSSLNSYSFLLSVSLFCCSRLFATVSVGYVLCCVGESHFYWRMHCTIRNGSISTASYRMAVIKSCWLTVGSGVVIEGLVADISPRKTFW